MCGLEPTQAGDAGISNNPRLRPRAGLVLIMRRAGPIWFHYTTHNLRQALCLLNHHYATCLAAGYVHHMQTYDSTVDNNDKESAGLSQGFVSEQVKVPI